MLYYATNQTTQTIQSVSKATASKTYTFSAKGETSYGYDYDYYIDNTNVSVTCKYDFSTSKYTFTVTGKSAGTVNVELRYKTNDTTWQKHNVKLNVDSQGNVSKIG